MYVYACMRMCVCIQTRQSADAAVAANSADAVAAIAATVAAAVSDHIVRRRSPFPDVIVSN